MTDHLTTDQQSEAQSQAYRRAEFVSMHLPSGVEAFTTLPFDKTIDGITYSPTISYLGISGIEANINRRPRTLTMDLPATDRDFRDLFLQSGLHMSEVRIGFAFLDKENEVIGGIIPRATAFVSKPQISFGEEDIMVSLSLESITAKLLRPRRVIANDADQKWRRQDRALRLVQRVPESEARWGSQKISGRTPGGDLPRRRGALDEY